jgi:hypothetical protein
MVLERDMNTLFCPTVGPILSGDSPGVSLYNVLILSRRVYIVDWRLNATCAKRQVYARALNVLFYQLRLIQR